MSTTNTIASPFSLMRTHLCHQTPPERLVFCLVFHVSKHALGFLSLLLARCCFLSFPHPTTVSNTLLEHVFLFINVILFLGLFLYIVYSRPQESPRLSRINLDTDLPRQRRWDARQLNRPRRRVTLGCKRKENGPVNMGRCFRSKDAVSKNSREQDDTSDLLPVCRYYDTPRAYTRMVSGSSSVGGRVG